MWESCRKLRTWEGKEYLPNWYDALRKSNKTRDYSLRAVPKRADGSVYRRITGESLILSKHFGSTRG